MNYILGLFEYKTYPTCVIGAKTVADIDFRPVPSVSGESINLSPETCDIPISPAMLYTVRYGLHHRHSLHSQQ